MKTSIKIEGIFPKNVAPKKLKSLTELIDAANVIIPDGTNGNNLPSNINKKSFFPLLFKIL